MLVLPFVVPMAHAAPFAYLTTNSTTVKVFDFATNTATNLVLPGPVGTGVAVNRQGTRVYLAGVTSRSVNTPLLQVIDATRHTAMTPIALNGPTGAQWAGVAVNPAGDRVYVANPDGRYVAVVDPDAGQVVTTIPITGKPANLVFSPDGTRLYVTNGTNGTGDSISVVDPRTNTIVGSVAVSNGPTDLSFNPQGTRLYVTHPQGNVLSVIDTTNHTVVTTVPVVFSPVSLVVSHDGNKLYVSDYTSDGAKVAVFDTRTHTLLSTIPVGNRSTGISITPDGRKVLVVNYLTNNVSLIDSATDTVTATVAVANVGGPFYGVFVTPNAAPTASAVSISGTAQVGQTLAGHYTYADAESNSEGASTFRWMSDSVAGAGASKAPISEATHSTYNPVVTDQGNILFFCVTPVAATGTTTGTEVCSAATAAVAPVNGACGSAHAATPLLTTAPSANLCASGTASSVSTGPSAYTWTCAGTGGGADSGVCSAGRGYTVTPSAGAHGAISPSTPQVVAYNATPSFTITPNAGYTASVSGCGGSLTGTTYTTAAVTEACAINASFAIRQNFAEPSPTGSGTVTTTLSGGGGECGFASSSYQLVGSVGAAPPVGYSFPHGVLNFTTGTCTTGGTVNVTLTYPQTLPEGTKFYKYGPATPGAQPTWYEHPATISGNTIHYSVTDGGQGDGNAAAGVITDPAGAAVPAAVASVPMLNPWAMLLMGGLMAVGGFAALRRRMG